MNDINNLNEEIFCLKYELETLANVTLRAESERWVPGYLHKRVEHSHVDRYKLACNFSAGLNVIDIACGSGKGSYLMATEGKANSVSGFDINAEAIRYAKWRNAVDNIEFGLKNAEEIGISNQYDLAVSFETIEHLNNYRAFLNSIVKCLKPNGLFLVSTPISRLVLDSKPTNPYHVQEWGFEKFHEVLKDFFDVEKVYVQLYPLTQTISKKVLRRVKAKLGMPVIYPTSDFSQMEEFTGQYPIKELGTLRKGYQIILAKKKQHG